MFEPDGFIPIITVEDRVNRMIVISALEVNLAELTAAMLHGIPVDFDPDTIYQIASRMQDMIDTLTNAALTTPERN